MLSAGKKHLGKIIRMPVLHPYMFKNVWVQKIEVSNVLPLTVRSLTFCDEVNEGSFIHRNLKGEMLMGGIAGRIEFLVVLLFLKLSILLNYLIFSAFFFSGSFQKAKMS